jgi:hypothetical protein
MIIIDEERASDSLFVERVWRSHSEGFTRIKVGAATTAVRDSISSHLGCVSSRCVYTRAMGRRNYLIDGVSGAGKTAVCAELQRRGYQAIQGDRELAYLGDPDTGRPTDGLKHEHSATFISEHHIWDVAKVNALVANQDEAITFFCGGSQNSSHYRALFDGVFVLVVDLDTSLRRIEERVARDPTDWGGTPEERDITVRMYHTQAALPQHGTLIDATAPLARVVDEILRHSDANTTR